jgi:adenylate cyclase
LTDSASSTNTSPDEPATEVRTFLFADVRGYTRFTQEHGDEAGAKLAARFAQIARDVVTERAGEVIELRGDEALAVFASARQALRTATELQKRFAEEAKETQLPLKVGIGVCDPADLPFETTEEVELLDGTAERGQ